MKRNETPTEERVFQHADNPDGINVADAYLKGTGMRDVHESASKDKEGKRKGLGADIMSSLVNGVSNVPDGLATAMMVGVNPIHGLYASILGPTIGSLLSSSQVMLVSTTVAASVFAGQAIMALPEEQRLPGLFTFVFISGIALLIFGLLRFGRLMKYISYPVMRGFMYGVGLLLILGQFSGLVGYAPEANNSVMGFVETFMNMGKWDWWAVLISIVTLITMLYLRRTPAKLFASALALAVGTIVVLVAGLDSVQTVQDISAIPRGLPEFSLPSLTVLSPQLIFSAIGLAAVTAVQGMGVSQMAENPDGSPVDPSRDMIAQGAANIGAGLFSGIPVGGSIGSTALNMTLGAQSRLAGILAGLWMLAIVLVFPVVVEKVPMPALTSLIMVAGFGAVNVKDSVSILKSGWSAVLGFTVTLLCVLIFSIPIAVSVGIVLTILFYFVSSAQDISVTLHEREGDKIVVKEVPETLPSNKITTLAVEGNLFFAGAQTFKELLPRIDAAQNPVVLIRMRSQSQMGATLIDILDNYAEDLKRAGGKLYISGLDQDQLKYLRRSGKLLEHEEAEFFPETNVLGEATSNAVLHANQWIKDKQSPRIEG
ncbi:SulP family inorganic anion transporter [Jeotgalibaca sp. A122]|uniref:SulP family inorganic anion transporter n=1 Tax=Jeotgalibaca sp. A122 TaxID=3457322 RepID=UPI003FD676B2